MMRSTAFSKSTMPTASFEVRAANSAASLQTFAMSAPAKPVKPCASRQGSTPVGDEACAVVAAQHRGRFSSILHRSKYITAVVPSGSQGTGSPPPGVRAAMRSE